MNNICIGLLIGSASLSFGQSAAAQPPANITLSNEVEPVFQGGRHVGCASNFEVGRQDAEFGRGDWAYLRGSLTFVTTTGRPYFVLKLGVKSAGSEHFEAPAEAYLVAGSATNRADFSRALDGEEPGFRLFVYEAGQQTLSSVAEGVAATGGFTFVYSFSEGGIGANVPVDMRIRNVDLRVPENSTFAEDAPLDWLNCLQGAVEAAREE